MRGVNAEYGDPKRVWESKADHLIRIGYIRRQTVRSGPGVSGYDSNDGYQPETELER